MIIEIVDYFSTNISNYFQLNLFNFKYFSVLNNKVKLVTKAIIELESLPGKVSKY